MGADVPASIAAATGHHGPRRGVRAECEELRSVFTQPVALPAPVRAMPLDERPEPPRMVWNTKVAELMHDHVVEDLGRREYEPPVEGERATWRAGAPKRALPANPYAAVLHADALGLVLGQTRDDISRCGPRLRLADRGRIEPESRHLAQALLHDPPSFLLEHALHV